MATSVPSSLKQVKPILSLTHIEARRRVIILYKTWYRQIPFIKANYIIPVTKKECQQKLREEFYRHANVRDLRVIDMLLVKGQMELQEVCAQWKPDATLMRYWKETEDPKPKDFMSKFLSGHE